MGDGLMVMGRPTRRTWGRSEKEDKKATTEELDRCAEGGDGRCWRWIKGRYGERIGIVVFGIWVMGRGRGRDFEERFFVVGNDRRCCCVFCSE